MKNKIENKMKGDYEPTPARNISDLEKYLVLPGKTHGRYSYPDLLVSNERTHLGKDWNDAQKELHKEDSFMLTIRQFVDYLNLLKTGTAYDGSGKQVGKSKLDAMLSDIVEVKAPWRSEWLDAKFALQTTNSGWLGKKQPRAMQPRAITYHKIKPNGALEEVTEFLKDDLTEDKTLGIDLEYWLQNATSQGLPPSNSKDGNLRYWEPSDDAVAGFVADAVRAYLDCHGSQQSSNPALGVRAVKVAKTK